MKPDSAYTDYDDHKWRYTDEERPYAACSDCGVAYDHFPVEMVISNEQWEMINPTFHKGAGLLCHNCMIRRLRACGIVFVEVRHFSLLQVPKWFEEEDNST